MLHLQAQSIGVNFPITGRRRSKQERGTPGDSDPRFNHDARGRLVSFSALRDISLTLQTGSRLAIIGANGAGKSTLLQVLAGILAADEGSLSTHGKITALLQVGLGIQKDATGHRNITLRGLVAGLSIAEIEQQRDEIAAFSELGEFLHLPFSTYSAGMKMRLNFAIATAFQP